MQLTQAALEHAQSVVYQHMQPTPTYRWPLLSQAMGCEVWVKHENHTPTGAFKVRGGLVFMDGLSTAADAANDRVLVTATRGNHGQSVPYAARAFNRRVVVYVPEGNSAEKNAAMQAWGAELRVYGGDFDAAREEAERVAAAEDWLLVPSFHEHLVQGVATYGAELFAALEQLDTIYVPIGMGSGVCSLILMRDLLGRDTEIVGVVSEAADAVQRSIQVGKITTTNSALTFADGVATRVPHPQAFAIMQQGLARVVSVSDDAVADAIRLLYRTTHNVAEGAGAIATAALYKERASQQGKVSAVVLTGGNIDQQWFAQILSGATPTVA